MGYRFKIDKPVRDELRRIIIEQISRAVEAIDTLPADRAVHDVRRCCKRIRAALRLVRPALGDAYDRENARYRDIARLLAAARDARTVIAAYDVVVTRFADEIDRPAFAPIRRALTLRHRESADGTSQPARLKEARRQLKEAVQQAGKLSIAPRGFAALAPGLEITYDRARQEMTDAFADPSVETFHEWRKGVKYHRFHVHMLDDTWKPLMVARCKALRELSDLLGEDHDLAVLEQLLSDESESLSDLSASPVMRSLIQRRRQELQAQARPLGARCFAEKPKAHVRRIEAYWQAEA